MKSLVFAGGWYCASRPNGRYAVQIRDSHVETDRGRVEQSPGGNLLQLDIANDGRFAGHGGTSFNAFEWDNGWQDRGVAFGNNACIYDNADVLHVVRESGPPTYALGYDYCADDGTLIPTWQSYDSKTPLAHERGITDLWWWIEHGDIIVGQGGKGGLIAQHNGVRYQIAEGQTTFPRFNRDGDSLALAWVREDTDEAHLLWLTVAELLTYPPVHPQIPPVHPPPVPVPQPKPEPQKMDAKALPGDVYAIVVELHARNLELANSSNDDDRRALAKKIAETVRARKGERWGWKSNHGIGNANAKDAIAQLPEGAVFTPNQRQDLYIWDFFDGTTRKPKRSPILSETEHTDQYFVPVAPIDHLGDVSQPEPEPQEPPSQPDVPSGDVLARIESKLDRILSVYRV